MQDSMWLEIILDAKAEELDGILASPRARAICDGFSQRRPSEALCRRCGFAERFNR